MSPDAINSQDKEGSTPLHHTKSPEITKLLLEKMSPEAINAHNKYGKTAIDSAKDMEMLNLILEHIPLKDNTHNDVSTTDIRDESHTTNTISGDVSELSDSL